MAHEGTDNLNYYIEISNEMIKRHEPLRKIQNQLDDMSRLEWRRPADMQARWMRDFKTTAPYDAIRAGVRVLSGLDEDITIDPYAFPEAGEGDILAAKVKANAWEVALKWQMDRAARRRAILRQDVTRSALMYDEVVGQVVHLPTQIKMIGKLGGNPNRQRAALRYGDFAILLRNPKTVYTRYSDYMLEAVMYASIKRPEEIQAFWNNDQLKAIIDSDMAPKDWVVLDYVDYFRRVVFCYPGRTIEQISPGGTFTIGEDDSATEIAVITLMNEPWTLDFLPWAAVIGGTALEGKPENARFPLLYGILKADQWNNTNIIGTLMMSEAIAEAARPDVIRQGISPDSIEATYGQPGGTWDVPAGHNVEPMPPGQLDPALREALDRQLQDMSRATIPSVLVTAEALPDEPFAGFNQRIQQAMASLMPYKFLAERWFEEAYRLMLYWAEETDTPIQGYDAEEDEPQLYVINPADIDKDGIYLTVMLQQDVPIDKQQRMQTAIAAATNLKIPTRDILEMLGETDPERKINEWMHEQMDNAYFQGVLQHITFQAQQAIEEAQQVAAFEAQMQVQAQQAQEQLAGQQQGQPQQGGVEQGVEGAAFNPAEGGQPPAQALEGAGSQPQATGQTQAGEETV